MATSFVDIPAVVVDYVRDVFRAGNDKVSDVVALHPSMHEETLDHILIMRLSAAPTAFFANEQMGVSIESHWLGGRWMYGRWEIADIAFFILLRSRGHLVTREVALLQTKRLYSKEIPVADLQEDDYRIGIGRLVDRTDPQVTLAEQRAFSFDKSCVYKSIASRDEQISRIDQYQKAKGIPVFYGLYNPRAIPCKLLYPSTNGTVSLGTNEVGCRVRTSQVVHAVLAQFKRRRSPSYEDLVIGNTSDPGNSAASGGWRLETFIADEVLRCRQGRIFDQLTDANLAELLYARSAPIAAALTITIDFGISEERQKRPRQSRGR